MNCNNCNELMETGIYKCDIGYYNIYDRNMVLVTNWLTHDIPSNNPEIGSECNVSYCLSCHILFM